MIKVARDKIENLSALIYNIISMFIKTQVRWDNNTEVLVWIRMVPCEVASLPNPTTRKGWRHHRGTAISRKVVGKIARDNPERYCGWFLVYCFSMKFQRMAREAIDVCLRLLKESNKSRFNSYSVRNSVLIISHITFGDCRVHSFSDNLSGNSCIRPLLLFSNSNLFPVDARLTNKENSPKTEISS